MGVDASTARIPFSPFPHFHSWDRLHPSPLRFNRRGSRCKVSINERGIPGAITQCTMVAICTEGLRLGTTIVYVVETCFPLDM